MSVAGDQISFTDFSQLDPNGTYTYADYLLWQFKERVELIKGRLFKMSPALNLAHQRVATALTALLWQYFNGKTCQVFAAPFDVRLLVQNRKGEGDTVVQPDLCVICDPKKLDEKGCNGAPDLIVEVLSPGNSKREMRDKYQVYQEAGVLEYWIINPGEKVVLIYVLDKKGTFTGLAPLSDEDVLQSTIFPEFKIALKQVLS